MTADKLPPSWAWQEPLQSYIALMMCASYDCSAHLTGQNLWRVQNFYWSCSLAAWFFPTPLFSEAQTFPWLGSPLLEPSEELFADGCELETFVLVLLKSEVEPLDWLNKKTPSKFPSDFGQMLWWHSSVDIFSEQYTETKTDESK